MIIGKVQGLSCHSTLGASTWVASVHGLESLRLDNLSIWDNQ